MASTPTLPTIGVLFRLVWLKIDGTGLDGSYLIDQGHLFCHLPTNMEVLGALAHPFVGWEGSPKIDNRKKLVPLF